MFTNGILLHRISRCPPHSLRAGADSFKRLLGCTCTRLAPAPFEPAGQCTVRIFDVNNTAMLWPFGGRGRVQEERAHEKGSAPRNKTDLFGDSFSPHWYLCVAKP